MFTQVNFERNPRKMWGRNNRGAARHALRYRQTAPPLFKRDGDCNYKVFIDSIQGPPFQAKYKKSRNTPLRIGFTDLKKCYQVRMFKNFSNGLFADQVIAIREVIKCIQKSMIYEPNLE